MTSALAPSSACAAAAGRGAFGDRHARPPAPGLRLADERRAARDAILRLRLAPVLVEAGARAHSQRELYRAGSRTSTRVPATGPRSSTSRRRRPTGTRLTGLLDRVRADDRASHRRFASADEFAGLLAFVPVAAVASTVVLIGCTAVVLGAVAAWGTGMAERGAARP